MNKTFICFENGSGAKTFRPVDDIWQISALSNGNFKVVFHKASGDFQNEELTAEEMADIKTYAELFFDPLH